MCNLNQIKRPFAVTGATLLCAIVLVLGTGGFAIAEKSQSSTLDSEFSANDQARSVKSFRVINTDTAWIPPAGTMVLSGGIDHLRKPAGYVGVGLGGVAELGLSMGREFHRAGRDDKTGMAHFKMATPEGWGHSAVPAVSLSFRKTLADEVQFSSEFGGPTIAIVGSSMSKRVGPVSLHLGIESISARQRGEILEHALRPTAAIEWNPAAYPLTTLVTDLRWIVSETETDQLDTGWNLAWGVRYQALNWASVDLNVRHQEGESTSDAVVTLGLSGSFALIDPKLSLDRPTQP